MSGSESTRSQMESQRTNLLSPVNARTRSKRLAQMCRLQILMGTGTPPTSFVSVLRLGRSSSLERPTPVMSPRKFLNEYS